MVNAVIKEIRRKFFIQQVERECSDFREVHQVRFTEVRCFFSEIQLLMNTLLFCASVEPCELQDDLDGQLSQTIALPKRMRFGRTDHDARSTPERWIIIREKSYKLLVKFNRVIRHLNNDILL